MAYFPFMIEIADKHCLVAGGGRIAFHKVKILSDFGVHIRVVALNLCDPLKELAGMAVSGSENGGTSIELVQREFRDTDIDGMDFVVAATDDEELNNRISALCKQKHILINAVDMKEACSFIFPAMIKDRDLLVAVSTGGQSPAAAAYVKKQIRQELPDYYGEMIETLGDYRDHVLRHVADAKRRKDIFEKLLVYGDAHAGRIPKEVVEMLVKQVNEENG